MIKKLFVHDLNDIPVDWEQHLVKLWEEDDAPVPDKERTDAAFKRISGLGYDRPIYEIDQGDQSIFLYRGGWAKAVNCEGGWVGVLIRTETIPSWVADPIRAEFARQKEDGMQPSLAQAQGAFARAKLAERARRAEEPAHE